MNLSRNLTNSQAPSGGSPKHQATSSKHQASSAKPPGGGGRESKSSKHAKRATNCRMTICPIDKKLQCRRRRGAQPRVVFFFLYTLRQPQPPAKYTTFYRISKHDKSSHPASIWPLTMVHGSYIMVDMFNLYWRCL